MLRPELVISNEHVMRLNDLVLIFLVLCYKIFGYTFYDLTHLTYDNAKTWLNFDV